MRINNNYSKVEGSQSLVRDSSTGAILQTSDIEYENYKRKREQTLNQQKQIQEQAAQIDSLKQDLLEMREIITSLLKVNK